MKWLRGWRKWHTVLEPGHFQVVQYHWTDTAQSLLIPAEPPPGQTGAHSCGLSHSRLLLLHSSRYQRLYLCTMLLCITKMHAQVTQSSRKKKKGEGGGQKEWFALCVWGLSQRGNKEKYIYFSYLGKKSIWKKNHDCKLKTEKFELELKTNVNQNDHPLSSLKKEYWMVLTKPCCIRSKKNPCGYKVVYFFYSWWGKYLNNKYPCLPTAQDLEVTVLPFLHSDLFIFKLDTSISEVTSKHTHSGNKVSAVPKEF